MLILPGGSKVDLEESGCEGHTHFSPSSQVITSREVESGFPSPSNGEGLRSPPPPENRSGSTQAGDHPSIIPSNPRDSSGVSPFRSTSLVAEPEASSRKVPIRSLRDDLLGCPLEAITGIIPEDFM
jgi:hypothetical protein